MKLATIFLALALLSVAIAAAGVPAAAGQAAATGTIVGHVRMTGKDPGNAVIRMGKEPKCNEANAGKPVAQMKVVLNTSGDLANVFASLKGAFPKSAPPATAVTIDQKNCIFIPRVVGARVGQTLEFKNSDAVAHNAHGQTLKDNNFNLMQVSSAVTSKFQLKSEETMLKITCDPHSWMFAYVGVVNHPYFAVSNAAGIFTIDKVPVGTQTVQIWHEVYGPMTKTVTVTAGKSASVDFAYTGNETTPRGAVEDLKIPDGSGTVQLMAQAR